MGKEVQFILQARGKPQSHLSIDPAVRFWDPKENCQNGPQTEARACRISVGAKRPYWKEWKEVDTIVSLFCGCGEKQ